MKGKILVSLFALPFAGVGVWMLWSVSSTLYDAWQMEDWAQVEATLTAAGYETHSGDDSLTFEAYARYNYEYEGRRYSGDRVGIASGADNIGGYQQEIGRNLQSAHSNGERILVYVDPEEPSQSIIDRGVRWGLISFKMIFVIVFGGVGFGLLIVVWRAPKEKDEADPLYADKPWLLNDDWQSATIRSGSRMAMWGAWAFTILWNAISIAMPFLAYREISENGNWIALIALLFPLVGISLLAWAIRRTMEWRRFGPAPVTLDPFPGSIGGHVGGTIDLNLPFDPNAKFELTLTNIHSYMSGSGKNRSRKEKAEWQDRILAHAEPGGKGTRLTFRFDVPEALHASDAEQEDSYHQWRLNLGAELPGADLDRAYEIPVYATGMQSRFLSSRAVENARRAQGMLDDQSVRKLVNLDYGAVGKRMVYPMGRYLSSSIGGFLVGVIFAGAGWYLITEEGQRVFGGIFGGVGALIAVWCLYMILNSLEVTQTSTGIMTVRRLLGIPIKRTELRSDAIVELTKHTNFQTQSGGKHIIYYKIHAIDRDGNKHIVGEGFKGESQADAAIQLIGREFGILGARRSPESRDSEDDLLGPEVLG